MATRGKSRRIGRKLLLAVLGLVVGLGIAEGTVRLLWERFRPLDDVAVDYRTVPKPFPGRGYIPRPNHRFRAQYDGDPYDTLPPGERLTYWINESGFRDEPFPPHGPSGKPLVAVLGDSFTFGEGVLAQDRYSEVLETELAKAGGTRPRVLNLGVTGYSSEDEGDVAEAFLPRLAPDAVVLGYCLNDPVHLFDTTYDDHFGFDLVVQRDAEVGAPALDHPLYLVRLVRRLLWQRRLTRKTISWYRGLYDGPDAPWTRSRQHLLRARDAARRAGAPFVVLLFPIFFDLDGDYPFRKQHETVAGWLREQGVPVLDTLPLYEGSAVSDLVVHPKDHHPNARAHRLAGEALAKFLLPRVGGGPADPRVR